ncbi:MAG: polysaccharide deacetylase family protein [Bacteroidota bacterium]|nr:polysaccharide deacetylase family protein [Bacteroidota bacterium]
MHKYFIRTHWLVQKFFSNYIWRIPVSDNTVFLTFDDGPEPKATEWVLDQLKQYNIPATFFCVGENVAQHPSIYQRILAEGHAVGNHTYHHLNGWQVSTQDYLENVAAAAKYIQSNLFRPPYGRIRKEQVKGIPAAMQAPDAKIIMWEVLSCDFDTKVTPQQTLKNVLKNVQAGSIIIFHDSEKAFPNLSYALPIVLKQLKEKGFQFKKIEL